MVTSSIENLTTSTIDETSLLEVCQHVCKQHSIEQSVHIRLTDDNEMKRLNSDFRGVADSTDVLTFPSGLGLPFPKGDLAISVEYAARQAEARGVSLHDELKALVIHGVLHLVGFDDETFEDKKVMQGEMNKIGRELSIPIDAAWTSILHQDHQE